MARKGTQIKGLIQLLKEMGKYRKKMTRRAEMTKEIAAHQDFQEEKTASLVHPVHQHGHTCILLPKFHCEVNPICLGM